MVSSWGRYFSTKYFYWETLESYPQNIQENTWFISINSDLLGRKRKERWETFQDWIVRLQWKQGCHHHNFRYRSNQKSLKLVPWSKHDSDFWNKILIMAQIVFNALEWTLQSLPLFMGCYQLIFFWFSFLYLSLPATLSGISDLVLLCSLLTLTENPIQILQKMIRLIQTVTIWYEMPL